MSYYDAAKAFWKQWFSLNRSSSSDISWSTFLKRGLMFRVTNMRWHVYRLFFILKSCGNANIFWQRAFQRARRCPPEALSNRNCRDAFGKIPIIGMYHTLKNHCSATLAYIQHSRQVRKGSKAVTTALQKSPFSTMASRDSIGNIQRIPFNIILQSRLITFSTTV